MSAKVLALRAIPIAGWIFLFAAPIFGLRGRLLRALWWIDAVLSIGVHAAQIPIALRAAGGRSRLHTAAMTQIFGLTWWRTRSLRENPSSTGTSDRSEQ